MAVSKKVVKKEGLDYHEMARHINKKYKVDIRDYAGLFGKDSHFLKYQKETGDKEPAHWDCPGKTYRVNDKVVPKEEYDKAVKATHAHYQRYQTWTKKNPEPPYLDYWHWLLDNCFSEISNGCFAYFNIKDILEEDESPEWVKEITQMFYDEFKDDLDKNGGLEVYIVW